MLLDILKYFALPIATIASADVYAKSFLKVQNVAVDSAIRSVAAVGTELITDRDVEERAKLLMMFCSKNLKNETKQLLKRMILDGLILEKLKVVYAKKFNNAPDKEYVDHQQVIDNFNRIAEANGISPDEFKAKLEKKGVDVKTFLDQIYARLTWNAYISIKFGDQIVVSNEEINKKHNSIRKMLSKKAYNIERFFLPFGNEREKNTVREKIKAIVELLEAGIDFQSIVRQFSSGHEAVIGGDLGYIADGELPFKNENAIIKTMKSGDIQIVENNSGFSILKLNNIISANEEIFEVKYAIIPLTANPTQGEVESKIKQLQDIADKSKSASELVKNAELNNLQLSHLMSFPIQQIDPQLRQLLQDTKNGISKVVCTPTEVICACVINKRKPRIQVPSKDAIREKIMSDRMDLLAQHELEKAKKTIFVEYK